MCTMAIEAGGKSGIIVPDGITKRYVKTRAKRPYTFYKSAKNARYASVHEYDCSKILPTIACPHLPSNTRPAAELFEVSIDQVVIGSCTNGRLEDQIERSNDNKRKESQSQCEDDCYPGNTEDIPAGNEERAAGHFYCC